MTITGTILATIGATAAFAVVALHAWENWNEPEYPYSGYCPDCPIWNDDLGTEY